MKANEKLRLEATALAARIADRYPAASARLLEAAESFRLSDTLTDDNTTPSLVTVHDKDGELLERALIDLRNNARILENFANKTLSTV